MSSEGERFRVLIPTTAGAVEVLLLTEEDPVIARSVACIGGTTETADIDTAYDAFVSRPTGVVARLFGHPCYRLDVSGRIDAGSSWQLGVLTAHALHAAGRLAREGQKADGVLWATGSVRAVDLTVGAVSHVPEKLVASSERLQRELGSGARVLMALPAANARDPGCLKAAIEAPGATLLEVTTVQELWDRIALREPEGRRNAVAPEAAARAPLHGAVTLTSWASRRGIAPLMAPEPPRGFVERHEQTALLKARLLDGKGGIVALRGAGGFGKTSLANRLCRDPDVRTAYSGGILHVELGEKPDNLVARIADLVVVLTGERSGLQTVGALSAALAAALGEGRHLLVIDDVWREQDLAPFLQGGPNTTRLVTTRLEHVLPADAFRVPVDAMQGEEAVALLALGLPAEQCVVARAPLLMLAARLGEWPLQLTLVNGFLRDRVLGGRRPLAQAIADVNRRLEARGLTAFDARNDAARHRAVDKTLAVSLELLPEGEQAQFRELAVFPEDTDVPVGICARLWRETGGLNEIDTEDLLQKLFGHSLLLALDLEQRTFRLHDVVRQYLLDGWKREPAADAAAALHAKLIAAIGDLGEATFGTEGERRYAYQHRAGHLAAAGQREKLSALLQDPRWMQDKLRLAGPQSLISDYRIFGAGRAHELIGDVLDLGGRILAKEPGQLAVQMLARLAPQDAEGMDAFLAAAADCLPSPALVPARPTFTAPGAEVRRFEGHQGAVESLAVVDTRRFVSCSRDGTLRLWDASTGNELRRFEGHEGAVFSLARVDGHRVLSGSADRTIRLWDVETGRELSRLVGHGGGVTCVALMGTHVVSGSEDRTLRLWNLDTGQELRRFELPVIEAEDAGRWPKLLLGHERGVTSLAVMGSCAVCGLDDRSLRLIDLETGEELRRFGDSDKYARPVFSLAALDGGRFLAGGSDDGFLRLWEAETGRELGRFEGVRFWATTMAVLDSRRVVVGTSGFDEVEIWEVGTAQRTAGFAPQQAAVTSVGVLDGQRILSGGLDGSIRLWDPEARENLARFKGLEHYVDSFAVLDDRRILSGTWRGALTAWDAATGEEVLRFKGGHEFHVADIAALDCRRALSAGGSDKTIRLWDLETGEEMRQLKGHEGRIAALAVIDSGRFLSCSADKTLRLWDVEMGQELRRFEGHEEAVHSLALIDCCRFLSASNDHSVRVWEVETGRQLCCLDGHEDAVYAVAAVDGRRVLSGSADKTLRLWDVEAGRELRRFDGHERAVLCLVALDGRHAVSGSSDRTLRLWDLETGAEMARFDGDAAFTSVAFMSDKRTLLARDAIARLHWIEVRLA